MSDQTIQSGFLRSVSQQEGTEILGFDPGSAGLAFVYPGTNGTQAPFVQIKLDRPFSVGDGRPAKYLTAKDAGNRLYVPHVYADINDRTRPIIFTEGEKKAAKGAEDLDGFIVLGLAGVWCWKTKDHPLIDDLKRISWKVSDRTPPMGGLRKVGLAK